MLKTVLMMGRISSDFRAYVSGEWPGVGDALADELEGGVAEVSVRVNRRKGGEVCDVVRGCEGVEWCDDGFYLDVRPDFTLDPAMHQGRYYVQDASSMILWRIVRELAGRLRVPGGRHLRYLDGCAAPGGKTTAAMGALPDDALVVANEFDFKRAEVLRENVVKWGKGEVVVSRGDTRRFRGLPGWFDIVAADVPCSGEGMMRKDAKACEQWSVGLVDECAARQREIVENLWVALRPGGYMIYSTCTFNRRENEDVMRMIVDELGGEPVRLEGEVPAGVIETELMWRFMPGRVRGEGLAVGVVRKPEGAEVEVMGKGKRGRKGEKGGKPAVDLRTVERWVAGDDVAVMLRGDEVWAVDGRYADDVAALEGALDVIHAGVWAGQVKGRDVAPAHGLAMSWALRRGMFEEVEVDRAMALAYLRREALQGIDAGRGMVLLTYEGWPLGFVNHLGSRSNNMYPQGWRILKRC